MNELEWVNFTQKIGQSVVLPNLLLSTKVEVQTFGIDGIGRLKVTGPRIGLIYARVERQDGQQIYGVIYNLTPFCLPTWIFKSADWPAICPAI